jgi:flagellar protein FliO/FliZ
VRIQFAPPWAGARRRLLVVIGWVVLATVPVLGVRAESAADKPPAPDTVLYPKGSAPAPLAEPTTRNDSGYGNSTLLVVALLLAAGGGWVLWRRRAGPGFLAGRTAHKLRIEETRSLGNRQYLVVAAYEGKKLLLGVTPGQIQLLTTLSDGEEKP